MAKEGNTKKERIEKLEEEFLSLTESVSNMETSMGEMKNKTCSNLRLRIENLENKTCYRMIIAIVVTAIIVSIGSFFMLQSAKKEIDALQEEVKALQTINVVSMQPNATEAFINAIFPMEDHIWSDHNGNTFYSDPNCKYAITTAPEFCSNDYIFGEDSSGNSILVYRLKDGSFAYIPSNFRVNLWRAK